MGKDYFKLYRKSKNKNNRILFRKFPECFYTKDSCAIFEIG